MLGTQLDWAETFLNEYFFVNNPVRAFGLKRVFAYGVGKGKQLIRQCENDYQCNMPAMIRDARSGQLKWAPFPVQTIYEFVQARNSIENQSEPL